MAPERDVAAMLDGLTVERQAGTYTFITSAHGDIEPVRQRAVASIAEAEGETLIVALSDAIAAGFVAEFEAAWLTLNVHSALDAVGLTAVVAGRLAAAGLACNVLAGYYHDHLLVPSDRADEAIAAIEGRSGPASKR